MTDWNFLKDDWKKIPPNLRYLILAGAFLILNTWLLDHWRSDGTVPYRLFGVWDIRAFSYSTGFILISVSFALLIGKQFSILQRRWDYIMEYPLERLDDTFHLVWFKKTLYLFDNAKKQYFHVYPWETAQDLSFTHFGVRLETAFPSESDQLVQFPNGSAIHTADYKNGGSINTQI